jgi:hypothetical protein
MKTKSGSDSTLCPGTFLISLAAFAVGLALQMLQGLTRIGSDLLIGFETLFSTENRRKSQLCARMDSFCEYERWRIDCRWRRHRR